MATLPGAVYRRRFCDEDGAILPIYQLLTEWPDEFFADNSYSLRTKSLAHRRNHDRGIRAGLLFPRSSTTFIMVVMRGMMRSPGPGLNALWDYADIQ